MASPILPALDTLATMSSAAAAEAATAVQERERVPDPVRGWYGDGDAMRIAMPGAIVKSADGTKHYVIPITGAVKRNVDGTKVRLGEWAGSDSPLRDSEWAEPWRRPSSPLKLPHLPFCYAGACPPLIDHTSHL